MIRAGDEHCVIAAHAVVADQAVHDGLVEGVAHVQGARDIGRRKLNCKGLRLTALGRCGALPGCKQASALPFGAPARPCRSEEHTSELQSLMRNSYAVFCLKKKK